MARKSTTSKTRTARGRKASESTDAAPKRQRHDDEALTAQVVERTENGEKLGAVASDLGITAGKAAFLLLIKDAEDNPRTQVKVKSDDEVADKVSELRSQGVSWGVIAARLKVNGKRLSEPKIKRLYQDAGGEMKTVHEIRPKDETTTTAEPRGRKATAKGKGSSRPSRKG
jgi:hypothetical protein